MNKSSFYQVFTKPVLFLLLVIVLAGMFFYNRMQTSLFPEVTFPKITLIADNGQQPIDRMMITVTKPLESAVKRVKGVTIVKSSTSRGSCVVQAYFGWDIDIYNAKTQVESRINEIRNFLPAGTTIVIEPMNQSIFPVMGFTLESTSHTLIELRNTALFLVRPQFSQVQGISNAVVRGGKTKEYVLTPDPQKMVGAGITPAMISTAIANNNFVSSNGMLNDYRRLYLTLTDTRVKDIEDLKQVMVKNDGSRIVRLTDIARIDLQEQQEFIKINANGNEAVLIDLVKQQGTNLLDFADAINAKADELRRQLPKGMILKPYYNQSVFVNDSIDSVIHSIYEGLFLAIIVVIVFLRSFRASLNVILIIPITLALTVIVIHLFGITLNIMSLGAIAASIGLIIDDAIVVIEQIYRVHEEHPEKDRFTVVREAIHDLFPAMLGSSLSTIVIHFPFALMSGVAGSFFKELSLTMQLTMVCSFFVTWIGTPVLHLWIGYKPHQHRKKHIQSATEETADAPEQPQKSDLRWLVWFFYKPLYALGFMVVLIASSYFILNRIETGFLPDLDEGTIVLDYFSPPGTSLEETDRMLREAEKIIIAHPDVESYSRRTGIRMAFSTVPANFGDYSIQLKQSRTKKTVDVIDELRKSIEATQPALHVSFGQRISDLLGDLMSSASPIEIKIFGDNQDLLKQLAQQAETELQTINGIADINNGIVIAGPSMVFIPDQTKLAQYKISLTDFQMQINAHVGGVPLGQNANNVSISPAQSVAVSGLQIGQIQEGEQMLRVLMRFKDYGANNLEAVKQQPIFLPDGTTRPVSFFATVNISAGETEIKREDLKSNIIITARLDNRDLGSAIKEINAKLNAHLTLPQGYSIVYGGAYSEQQASFRELLLILVSAIILVFIVLLFLFKDFGISFLILLISVLGIGGCLWGLFVTGIPLNVGSYTGIIMIVGIIAENAIFTVNQFLTTFRVTGNVDESINYAISLRIRPKLMTAIGAILALMPLALGIGLGAQMQQPLAVAVIGGFVVAMPLLLFVFPSLLRLLYNFRNSMQ
jgi:multidrug efflux pump subunit AcrB